MSGFTALAAQGVILLALVALVGMAVGWSFGSIRTSRTTSERYDQQLRATMRRMSEAEADVVTLRANLQEKDGTISSQSREHESREHLLAALEARLAEAEGAAEEAKRSAAARAEEPQILESTSDVTPADHNGATSPALELDTDTGAPEQSDIRNDDLTRIKGIGKVIEERLNGLGITTFAQVAGSNVESLSAALGAFKGRMIRDDWTGSAAELHRTEYGEHPSD